MKKTLLIVSFIAVTGLVIVSLSQPTSASSSLPPNQTAGAPADAGGQNCAACHNGSTVTNTTGVIFTDIPASGYVANAVYNVTVTMSGASAYGFELTPQTPGSSAAIGTWIAGSGTSVSTKYIKQNPKKTGASATWTFQWKAPATATTAVTFYGSFNYCNNNGSDTGDQVKKSSETYTFSTATSIANLVDNNQGLVSVFPNPVVNTLHINSSEVFTKGLIYNIDGKLMKEVNLSDLNAKVINVEDLASGVYNLVVSSEKASRVCKFIKN